jgi:hypothetical protein
LRFSVVGQLLAAPPEKGALAAALAALAAREWRHPTTGAPVRFGASTIERWYYRALRELSPGLEFYGGIGRIDDSDPLDRQQHYIFHVLWGELPGGFEYNFGPGFGLTRGSDQVITKFNVECERFIGALLK